MRLIVGNCRFAPKSHAIWATRMPPSIDDVTFESSDRDTNKRDGKGQFVEGHASRRPCFASMFVAGQVEEVVFHEARVHKR